jgi:hypothetical protein
LGFYRNTGVRLKAAGVATIRLDHTGKDHTKGMRGGSAKYGDVDAVWAMTRLTDTTFHLECTANRLPITEKELTITRHPEPLHHTVNTGGRRAALDAKRLDLQRALDELFGPGVKPTFREAAAALREVGHSCSNEFLSEVIHERATRYLPGL